MQGLAMEEDVLLGQIQEPVKVLWSDNSVGEMQNKWKGSQCGQLAQKEAWAIPIYIHS
jgi:hypothetical protein